MGQNRMVALNMTKYEENERVLLCYLSGQMSERQWQAHCADRAFRGWLTSRQCLNNTGADVIPFSRSRMLSGFSGT